MKNPRTTIRNCQTSDAKIFLSTARGAFPGTHGVSYIRAASTVKGLPQPYVALGVEALRGSP
jgi:hypothetical protein